MLAWALGQGEVPCLREQYLTGWEQLLPGHGFKALLWLFCVELWSYWENTREAGASLCFQQGWVARVNVLSSQQLYLRLQWVESFEYFLFNNQGFIAVRIQEEQVYLSLPPLLVTSNS